MLEFNIYRKKIRLIKIAHDTIDEIFANISKI